MFLLIIMSERITANCGFYESDCNQRVIVYGLMMHMIEEYETGKVVSVDGIPAQNQDLNSNLIRYVGVQS